MSESAYFYGTKHNEYMERLYKETERELLIKKQKKQQHIKNMESELTRFKELNREMVEVLKDISVSYYEMPVYQQKRIIKILAKAEGKGND